MTKPAPNLPRPEVKQHNTGGRPTSQPSAWVHARVRSTPRLLTQAPRWVRQVFDHAWAPVEALSAQARLLPARVWDYLLNYTGGFAVICPGESYYLPGPAIVRGQSISNAAFVSVEDLAHNNDRPLHVLGHLIDHHLGCGGDLGGPWLTEGGGMTSDWQQAGSRLAGLYPLGYGVDEVACSNIQDYFAQSLAIYARDRQRLNVADPQIYRLLRDTIFNDSFWQSP